MTHIGRDESLDKNDSRYISDFGFTIDALVPDSASLSTDLPLIQTFESADIVATTATGNNNIDGLLAGVQWAALNVSFSFSDSFSNDYEANYQNASAHAASFQMFNANQQNASRNWIAVASGFGNVSLLNPVELTGIDDRDASIRMAVSNHPPTAYAYYPGSAEGGDIWVGTSFDYTNPVIGNGAYIALGHELGHALGLQHGFYTGGVRNVAMNPDRDSMEFSIMTRSYIGAPPDYYFNAEGSYAQTLMMYDIAAIQHMYGASFDSNSDNTTYTFSTATGEMFINGVGQGTPFNNHIFRTIWDGGGTDSYNFSNYTTNLNINLMPGGWVDLDIGGNFQRAELGNGNYARAQVFNALQYKDDPRSLIEGALAGTGNDIITGNAADNILIGQAGNDILNGGTGNDFLFGGEGIDTMKGGVGSDSYYIVTNDSGDTITEGFNEGSDIIASGSTYTLPINVEILDLYGELRINGTGNNQDNTLIGNDAINQLNGLAGNDTIRGEAGNDTLRGWSGVDNMIGGLGNDIYYVENAGDVVTEKFNEGTDAVNSSVTYVLTANLENLTLTGTLAINGVGNGQNNILVGNGAINRLNGGAGNDTLDGGTSINSLTGGIGNDNFRFTTKGHIDTITDYNVANDTIQLENSVFTKLITIGTLTASQFRVGQKAMDTNDFIIYNKSLGTLLYDSDGIGAAAATQIATIGIGLNLTNSDIVVI